MSRAQGTDPVVLLVSSNGAGMGHLTRLLAYARRLPGGLRPHVVSLSQAAPVVATFGVPWEYLPSREATGMDSGEWRWLFGERIREAVQRLRPAVLVFDGTHPYAGLDAAIAASPGTRAVWSRRAMWKAGRNTHQLAKASWFDVVLEPGDLSAAADRGATVGTPARRVGPVTLVDPDQCTDRAGARAALGLPADGPLALVSLGAGTINDTTGEVGAAVSALAARGVGVCVTQASIAEQAGERDDVHLVRHFPVSEHLAAFDVAVAAAGYNSFHEHLRLGLPTLFVPNDETSLDDQVARAGYAAERGWAVTVRTLTDGGGQRAVDTLLEQGPAMAERAPGGRPRQRRRRGRRPPRLAGHRRSAPVSPLDRGADRRQTLAARVRRTPGYLVVKDRLLPRLRANATLTDVVWRVLEPPHGLGVARRTFGSPGLTVPDPGLLPVVVFTVLGADEQAHAAALDAVTALRDETRAFRAVVVTDHPDLTGIRARGVVVDHVLPESAWYGDPADHGDYVGRRLVSVVDGFRPWHVVHLGPSGTLGEADARLLRAVARVLPARGPGERP